MNGKISLAVTLAFIIALSSFIPFYEKYRVPNVWEIDDDPFFQKISQINNEKLLIIGGSAVGQLNSTYLNKVISDRIILGNDVGLFPSQEYVSESTPFYSYSKDRMEINEQSKLYLDIERTKKMVHQNPSNSEQLTAFQDTIEILQKNKIKVVIFTVPLHQSYLDVIPKNDKIVFNETLENLSQKYDVKIYNFTNSYSNQNVWKDSYHVALHPNSLAYSNDIVQMIIREMP